jgi:hypothetical protein
MASPARAHGDRWQPCFSGPSTPGSRIPRPPRFSWLSPSASRWRWSWAFLPPPSSRQSGRTDPGFVVIDEVIGQWIALFGSPADWRHGLIALVLFRLFDITKPFPVRRLERLPGGWGIVFDDVAAGLYALGVASLLRIWI